MKNLNIKIIPIITTAFLISTSGLGLAADAANSFTLMPVRYISVDGDAAKFRALNWMNDGYAGGIKDMSIEQKINKDTYVSFEGHAITGDNDFESDLLLTKSNFGYLKLNYGNFRKYYDVYGGNFSGFTGSTSVNRMDPDPAMDIGHFLFEVGTRTQDGPGVSLSFERRNRDGYKNSLTWGKVVQGATTKYINPSWEQVNLVSDEITLKTSNDLAGFGINTQQKVQFLNGRTYREEMNLPWNTTNYLQKQEKEPQSIQLLSSLKVDRWIIDDRSYVAFAYQFQHLKNTELETLYSVFSNGTLGSGKNRYDEAQTSYDSSTWVQHFVQNFTPNFTGIFKMKEEVISRNGSSTQSTYNSAGTITATTPNIMENKTTRTGESVSFRYTGIPKTSLYTDVDFVQKRDWISDWRQSTSGYINAIDKGPEGSGAVGVRYVPNKYVNMSSQLRHKTVHNHFNTLENTDAGWSISRLEMDTNEWSNRITYKPFKWFENSFRLQLIDNIYHTQSLDQGGSWTTGTDWLKSQANQRIYSYNAVLQPNDQWMFDLAFSLDHLKISTPASQKAVSSGGIPVFTDNVNTWLMTVSYAPKDNFSLYSSVEYSRAKNFDSQAYVGIPLGVDNERYNTTLGMKWSPKKNVSLEPHYWYYSYRANESIDYGNYSAHVFWLDAKFNW